MICPGLNRSIKKIIEEIIWDTFSDNKSSFMTGERIAELVNGKMDQIHKLKKELHPAISTSTKTI